MLKALSFYGESAAAHYIVRSLCDTADVINKYRTNFSAAVITGMLYLRVERHHNVSEIFSVRLLLAHPLSLFRHKLIISKSRIENKRITFEMLRTMLRRFFFSIFRAFSYFQIGQYHID